VWYGRRRRVLFGGGCFPCTDCTGQRNDFELIPTAKMESGHPVQRAYLVASFRRSISLGNYMAWSCTSFEILANHLRFFKINDPLRGNFQNYVPKRFTATTIRVLCVNVVKFDRPEMSKVVRCLPDKKTKVPLALVVASARIAPKICQAQRQAILSQCPKFNPNGFTSGGVIAERLSTVETHRKVFPIFGRSL